MISVSQHLSDFRYDRDRGRFRGWVQSITTNKVRDRMRADRRSDGAGTDMCEHNSLLIITSNTSDLYTLLFSYSLILFFWVDLNLPLSPWEFAL